VSFSAPGEKVKRQHRRQQQEEIEARAESNQGQEATSDEISADDKTDPVN
jgi:hypothetical protein